MAVKKNIKCPLCGSVEKKELWKSSYFLLYACGDCGTNYQDLFRKIPKEYDASYFEANHRKAYGKTYLEDEANIRSYARRRLGVIRKIMKSGGTGKLLDIGSALGTFCDEARKAGFSSEGVEVSRFARDFAKKTYGLKSYPELKKPGKEKYGCVTMWFTLEHMDDPDRKIADIKKVLRPGGVLALSVPNGGGTYARFNPSRYFIARPAEHRFEPTLRGMRTLLEKHGFRTVRTEIFGLHPERFGLPGLGFIKRLIRFLKWGDTFEIYARLES